MNLWYQLKFWANQHIHSVLVGCLNPCLQGMSIWVVPPQLQLTMCWYESMVTSHFSHTRDVLAERNAAIGCHVMLQMTRYYHITSRQMWRPNGVNFYFHTASIFGWFIKIKIGRLLQLTTSTQLLKTNLRSSKKFNKNRDRKLSLYDSLSFLVPLLHVSLLQCFTKKKWQLDTSL